MDVNHFCPTCLSEGRKMFPFPLNYTKLPFSTFYKDLKLTAKDMICWECRSFILKMAAFRHKALKAQANLAVCGIKPGTTLQSLSKLAISKGINLDIIDSPEQPDPLILDQVKTETDIDITSDETNELGEGNYEIDDVKVEISEEDNEISNDNENDEDIIFQVFHHKTRMAPEFNNQKVTAVVNNYGNIANATLMSLLNRKSSHLPFPPQPNETTSKDPSYEIEINIEKLPQEPTNIPERPEPKDSQTVTNHFTEERLTEEEMRRWWESKRENEFYVNSIPVFRCEKCVEPFFTRRSFIGHQKLHTEMYGELACDICELRFSTESALAAHKDNHYRLLKCGHCAHKWDNPNSMRRHCNTEHRIPVTVWNCDVCSRQLPLDEVTDISPSSPLSDWSTVQSYATQAATPSPLSSSSISMKKRASKSKHGLNKFTRTAKKKKVDDVSDGTSRAEKIDDWSKESESDNDDEEISLSTVFDINLEPAILPANIEEDAKEWLKKEDAHADRTLLDMLPDLTFDWSDNKSTAQREDFTASPGPTFVIDGGTPLSVFGKFFDVDLLDFIVTQTNENASVLIDKITTENSRLLKWKNTDRGEVVIFLAIIILQGLAPLNAESDYWKENGYLTLKYFKDLMTYNRFVLIKRLLHFNSHTDVTELSSAQRKLQKIWPVLDDLNRKFSRLYTPHQNIVIDDSLFNWQGRSFAEKLAVKAITSYELCDAESGYLWRFCVSAGAEVTNRQMMTDIIDFESDMCDGHNQLTVETQNTAQIVNVLVEPLLGKGYTLIMDSLFNSPLLARYIKAQATDCYGTLRVDREFVPESVKCLAKDIRFGETVQKCTRDMSIVLWRDTNLVALISTFHGSKTTGKEKHGKRKPEVVLDYNNAKLGVEKKNQLLSAYPMERFRNQAWYKKVFRRLLNVTIHNAYIIFKTQNPINSRAFRQRLADEMIMTCRPQIQSTLEVTPIRPGQDRPIIQGNHFIGQGLTKNARCVWCRRSRSKYVCKQCGVSLCIEVCFEEYHTKL